MSTEGTPSTPAPVSTTPEPAPTPGPLMPPYAGAYFDLHRGAYYIVYRTWHALCAGAYFRHYSGASRVVYRVRRHALSHEDYRPVPFFRWG